MEYLTLANEVIILLTGALGLIGTAISTYIAVKCWAQSIKTKNSQEVWKLIMEMADSAMTEAERTLTVGADKKTMALEAVEAAAKAAELDISGFTDQLNMYIDQTIAFVNKMKNK